jgi:hypothetical protein
MTRQAGLSHWRLIGVLVATMVLFTALSAPAFAARGDLKAAFEAPQFSADGGLTHGAARFKANKEEIRVAIGELDAARFPAGCPVFVSVGSIKQWVTLVDTLAAELTPGVAAATEFDLRVAGTAKVGDRAVITMTCGANTARFDGILQ